MISLSILRRDAEIIGASIGRFAKSLAKSHAEDSSIVIVSQNAYLSRNAAAKD
jgi:hypothetical protein